MAELTAALDRLRAARERWNEVLLADPREHLALWELNGALVALVDRMLVEFDATEHARLWEDRRRELMAVRRTAEVVDRLRWTRHRPEPSRRLDEDDAAPPGEDG